MVTLNLNLPKPPSWTWRDAPAHWWPDPEALADACAEAMAGPAPEGLQDLLQGSGAPVLDMLSTVLSSRAAVQGLATGRAFAHHELRTRIPMPPELEPEVSVWDQGTVPVWQDGVLAEPKYFSFFQDAPVPVFNPNHRRKWRAHELLHAAQGFFWSPTMTRFEAYLGARLNELLPVVHWYHLDEAFRPRCPKHQDQWLGQRYCPDCEAAIVPWWTHSPQWIESQKAKAAQHFHNALAHFTQEWTACIKELDTGRTVETHHRNLNASSDSIGYLKGHWNRTTAWSFGAWVETFLVDGHDYFSNLDGAFARVAAVTEEMLGGGLSLDPQEFAAQRARRALQDLGYRAFLSLEWLEEGTPNAQLAEGLLTSQLSRTGALCQALLYDPSLLPQAHERFAGLLDAFTASERFLPPQIKGLPSKVGYIWPGWTQYDDTLDLKQLKEGFAQALPLTAEALGHGLKGAVEAFATSEQIGHLGRLSTRAAAWLKATDSKWAELAGFEAWLAEPPRMDDDAECFAGLPEAPEELHSQSGHLRPHDTLRRLTLSAEVAQRVLGESEVTELAAIRVRSEPRIIPLDNALKRVLELATTGSPPESWVSQVAPEALMGLLENSFLVWFPGRSSASPQK